MFKQVRVIYLSGLQDIGGSKKMPFCQKLLYPFPTWKKKLKYKCVIPSHSCLVIYLCSYVFPCLSITYLSTRPPAYLPICLSVYPDGSCFPGTGPWKRKAHCLECGSGFAILAVEDASKSLGLSESQLPHLWSEGGSGDLSGPFQLLRLSDVGDINSFSEILREIILLQKKVTFAT